MPPVGSEAFADALRRLDEGELARFVADLWAARGWETRAVDGSVLAERGDERRRIVVCSASGRFRDRFTSPPPDLDGADVLAVARDVDRLRRAAAEEDVSYVTPADFREWLLYAVDREQAARIAETHLDVQVWVDAATGLSGSEGDPTGGSGNVVTDRVPRGVLAVAVALLLVALAVTAATGGFTTRSGEQELVTPESRFTGAPETATTTPTEVPYPPGLSAGGVQNASALADNHLSQISGESYHLEILFMGPAAATGFGEWTQVRWEYATNGGEVYRLESTYRGAGSAFRRIDAYSNGETQYSRVERANETRYAATPVEITPVVDAAAFVRTLVVRYLTTSRSTVERVETENLSGYRITATGIPGALDPRATGYRVRAWLTPEGRIVSLSVQYAMQSGSSQQLVRVGIQYDHFRNWSISPPPWLDKARNATSPGTENGTSTETTG